LGHEDGSGDAPTAIRPATPALRGCGFPAGRALIGPLFAELRERGLKSGAYFSLIDWSDVDYPGFTRDSTRYAIHDDPARWRRFLEYYQGQVNEIAAQLQPDLWWFDGDWEHSAEEWKRRRCAA